MPDPCRPAEYWGVPPGTGSDANVAPDPGRRVGSQLKVTGAVLVRRLVLCVQAAPHLEHSVQMTFFDLDERGVDQVLRGTPVPSVVVEAGQRGAQGGHAEGGDRNRENAEY